MRNGSWADLGRGTDSLGCGRGADGEAATATASGRHEGSNTSDLRTRQTFERFFSTAATSSARASFDAPCASSPNERCALACMASGHSLSQPKPVPRPWTPASAGTIDAATSAAAANILMVTSLLDSLGHEVDNAPP